MDIANPKSKIGNPKSFDWRDDPMGHIVAVPDVRARFMRFQPGVPPGGWHSHVESGAVEVFVVLEGAMRFEIDDETVIATAGQAVVAWPYQKHRASCAGDTPAVIYLSVTPHRAPTHTYFDGAGHVRPNPHPMGTYTWCGAPAMGTDGPSTGSSAGGTANPAR